MSESHTPKPIPTVLHGYPVMSAIRDREYGNVWTVLCRRTEEYPWVGDERYITYKAWWSETSGRYETENGHYGAAHGMTYQQAHRDLLDRAGGRSGRVNEHGITDGPYDSGWTLIDGQRITVWVDRPSPEYCRIALATEAGTGCGDATLGHDGLCIQLPIDWTTQDKARAAALIAGRRLYDTRGRRRRPLTHRRGCRATITRRPTSPRPAPLNRQRPGEPTGGSRCGEGEALPPCAGPSRHRINEAPGA